MRDTVRDIGQLISDTGAGDARAFGEIVRRFQAMAYGYAYSILRDFHAAEDAAQEAFIDAHARLPQLRDASAFPGWFRRIVYKHCDRTLRRAGPELEGPERLAERPSGDLSAQEELERDETHARVLRELSALSEHQRATTTLFYIDGYSRREIAEFLEVPEGTVKRRLYDARTRLRERMADMVADTLRTRPLPDDFADTVVRAVPTDADPQRYDELMHGSTDSVEDARRLGLFVVEEAGAVSSAGQIGEGTRRIGTAVIKVAGSSAGIAGEAEGVPDPAFVRGFRGHCQLAREAGCRMAMVHGSLYDHAFCGFVPCFYYPVASLPTDAAAGVQTDAITRATVDAEEARAIRGELGHNRDATWNQAFMGGGTQYVAELGGTPVGYFHVDRDGPAKAREYGTDFGYVNDIHAVTCDGALAALRIAGEIAREAGETHVHLMESHRTLVTQTALALGGTYTLRGPCDLPGLDSELVAVIDFPGLTRDLRDEFESRLRASGATDLTAAMSLGVGDATVGLDVQAGRVSVTEERQTTHRILPRWVATRLYMGYYAGDDVLRMGRIPWDRSDGRTPDDAELDMQALTLPEPKASLFRALFPKLWPCASPDPDVWPWVMGRPPPIYQHEDAKSGEMKARIDALSFPWVGR
jgi:RNA polymerase sigma factor (sigma-70 family)